MLAQSAGTRAIPTSNARINPPPDEITQPASQEKRLMKVTLRAVGLNELLGRPVGKATMIVKTRYYFE